MSKCTDCKIQISIENAYRKSKKELNSRCKKCFNKYCMNRWIERKKDAIKNKGDKCYDCNRSFPYPAYDFHHLDPSKKEMNWNKMRQSSDVKLKKELEIFKDNTNFN